MEIRRINNGKIFYFGNDVIPKYSFNAKELDEETGMYYFEARYYRAPTFISRDPLMNEKPWLTPYHYCSNNPVGRIDPTGMMDDEYEFNQRGELLNVTKNDKIDVVIVRNDDGTQARSELYKAGTIKMHENQKGENYWSIKGDNNAKEIFEFLANNTSVEWGHLQVGEGGENGTNYLVTSKSEKKINFTLNGIKKPIKTFNHNHPNNTTTPSEPDLEMYDNISFHNWKYSKFQSKEVNCNIYTNKNGQSKYTPFYSRDYYKALNNMTEEVLSKSLK